MSTRNRYVHNVGELQVARSLVYSKYKRTKNLAATIDLCSKAIPILRKILTVNPDLEVVLRPIKNSKMNGTYFPTNLIEVDPRRSDPSLVLTTLCHEFVHAEQHFTGRYEPMVARGVRAWMGQKIAVPMNQKYEDYRNLPWEKEAFERQEELAGMVADELLKTAC